MKTVTITINGDKITAHEGENLLWVALDNDIYIPNLCAIRDKLELSVACRLCFVEIEGKEQPVTACTEVVTDGMVVNTRGEKALRLTRIAFELIMASHPVDCANCLANRNCELQVIASYLGTSLKPKRLRQILRQLPIDYSNPYFIYDPNKCVLCGRCIWECREHHGIGVLGFAHRGFERIVTTFNDEPIGDMGCQDCADCVNVCPSGALVLRDGKKRSA